MRSIAENTKWLRRARPLMGTLVEVGVHDSGIGGEEMIRSAFNTLCEIQACLSRFEAGSDIARFHALPAGASLMVRSHTAKVLAAAHALYEASDGLFDVTLRSSPGGWRCDGMRLHKLRAEARLDLGGIGKGYAVDVTVGTLIAAGCEAGWVNAGGDLRAFGHARLPISLRDEVTGGVRAFATLSEGAFATSHYDRHSRSQATDAPDGRTVRAHASVAAPLCMWADALTKLVTISGDASHPLLSRYGAQAWLH
jgi:thiamine biosynthesis lipoprotein